jgi:hypothetical protein
MRSAPRRHRRPSVRFRLAQELFRSRRCHATDRLIARIHGWIEFQLAAIQYCSFSYYKVIPSFSSRSNRILL